MLYYDINTRTKMFTYLKNLPYKEIFLNVFMLTLVVGTFIMSIISLFLGHTLSFWVTFVAFFLALYILWHYNTYRNIEEEAVMLLWTVGFIVFAHLFINHFGTDVVYILLLPMTAPILLTRKQLQYHGVIYLLVSMAIFSYGFATNEFHDTRSVSGFALLSFFVFLFGSTYHFAIEESYKKLEQSNKQKDFLLKEIHHRVKNNLNIVASILGLEKFETNATEVHKLIHRNKLRIESIAMVHEILYENSDLEKIDFKSYIQKLTKHIIQTEGDEDIRIVLDIVKLELHIEPMMQFGIIINELMTNSIKYALQDDEKSISITLLRREHEYKLCYKDSGRGEKEAPQGFGSSLIQMSVKQLDGRLNITHKDGLVYEIYFKDTV